MDKIKHTQTCIEETTKRTAAILAYTEQYPNFCKNCYGAGCFTYTDDPSPSGVSLGSGSFTYIDPCPACVEQDKCPRCGFKGLPWDEETEVSGPCLSCGWMENDPSCVCPPPYECFCWEDRQNWYQEIYKSLGED